MPALRRDRAGRREEPSRRQHRRATKWKSSCLGPSLGVPSTFPLGLKSEQLEAERILVHTIF